MCTHSTLSTTSNAFNHCSKLNLVVFRYFRVIIKNWRQIIKYFSTENQSDNIVFDIGTYIFMCICSILSTNTNAFYHCSKLKLVVLLHFCVIIKNWSQTFLNSILQPKYFFLTYTQANNKEDKYFKKTVW